MYLFHFDTSHHLETMKYEARNKTFSLERLNYQNATDRVSVFRATGKLHAIPNRGKKVDIYIYIYIYIYILFFPLDHDRDCYL